MSLRYQLRRESGLASSSAAFGVLLAVGVSGVGGVGLPLGGGGGASQVMMGVVGVASDCGAVTPNSWP